MSSAIYIRMFGYCFALVVHSYTIYDILHRLSITTEDPMVAYFAGLKTRFITVWTFALQIAYLIVVLFYDLMTLIMKKPPPLNYFGQIRETIFSAILFPTCLLIPALYWPIVLYDEKLLYPPLDKELFLSSANNAVMHGFVALVAFWELFFIDRKERNHKMNISLLVLYLFIYLCVSCQLYAEKGHFPYPILDKTYGTVYFILILAICAVLALIFYCIQWPLRAFIWRSNSIQNFKCGTTDGPVALSGISTSRDINSDLIQMYVHKQEEN